MAAVDAIETYVSELPALRARRLAHSEWGITVPGEELDGEPLDVGLRLADGLLRAQAVALHGASDLDPWMLLWWNRQTRLVRVPDLQTFRLTIATLALDGPGPVSKAVTGSETDDIDASRSRAVVVPTSGAARQLRRTLEDQGLQRDRVLVLPEIVTREHLYDRLHSRLPDPPLRLTPFERDAIAQRAAREAATTGPTLSFQLRPGLIGEMLRFYDHLRRQSQRVNRFEELITEALAGEASSDRGAERMRQQTRFLAETFRA